MADLTTKQPINNNELRALIQELLLEWEPQLRNDPQKLNNIVLSVEQDFYALAANKPELIYQTTTALQPLMDYLVGKQLELHTHPQFKPNPIKSLQKKCDELINEICKDDKDLELSLKKIVKESVGQAADPNQGANAVNTLNNLYTVLKYAKEKFTMKPIFEFLSDKDKANISIYALNPETGSHATTLTKTEPSPHVIEALNDAIKLTAAAKLDAPNQPIDEFGEVQKQNEGRALPTPFHTKPTPDKH
ncbi:MAG TPA: hypothetical protein VHM20_04340 [Gammaproteobacteria bacterium]|jgi:hypothetical protein|nr:hypothetical protein [Gammaproteobacteria bacterium]